MTHSRSMGWLPGSKCDYKGPSQKYERRLGIFYRKTADGTFDPPTFADELFDETGAGPGGIYLVPGALAQDGTSGLTFPSDVVESYGVELTDSGNSSSDVMALVTISFSRHDVTADGLLQPTMTSNGSSISVSAWRTDPIVPSESFTDGIVDPGYWDGTNGGLPAEATPVALADIGGTPVDWTGNAVQYALPTSTTSITVYRPAPRWDSSGQADTGLTAYLRGVQALVGTRNAADLFVTGDAGQVMLKTVSFAESNKDTYAVSLTFLSHPWKHAIQVPRLIGGEFANTDYSGDPREQGHIRSVWWNQPHVAGGDLSSVFYAAEKSLLGILP